jgi:hypothetical protein
MYAIEEEVEKIRMQVAERLGWRSIEYSKDGYLIGYPAGRRVYAVVPSYVRDIKAAWTLVEHLALYGIGTHVQADPIDKTGRSCSAEMEYKGKLVSRAQERTAPLAICQAYLLIQGDRLACATLRARP